MDNFVARETVNRTDIRCGSYQEMEVYRVGLEMQTCQNNLGFSLCAVPSICHMVATSED